MLRIRTPGAPEPDQQIALPPGDPLMLVGGADDVFLYWIRAAATRSFDIFRRDGRRRTVPLPAGLDPRDPQAAGLFFFDGPGALLFVRDGQGRLHAYSTASEEERDLGAQPRTLLPIESMRALLACGDGGDGGDAGLRRVPMDGAPAAVLDPRPCVADGLRVVGKLVYYQREGALWQVPLHGRSAPERAFSAPAQQLLATGPEGALVYSLDPPRRWASGASDGWVGDWRFMDRGRLPAFGAGGRRLRWLEAAATLSGAGDLLSDEVFGAAPLRLSRNVRGFAELADGRVLCVANYAFRGVQNRLVVIDEAARTARFVAGGASSYLMIPGTTDLLVQLVKDDRGFDLVRVPLPPP